MTREQLVLLGPGDCVVGFGGCFTDEVRVADVGSFRDHNGRASAEVCVVVDGKPVWTRIVEGGREIRCPQM